MNALILTLFVSAIIFVYGLVAFGFSIRQRDLDHAERLSLAPLADDADDAERSAP